jgi:phosphoribosylformylglycinamidine cyclo-ligase
MYKEGDYELVGFSVGIVDRDSLVDGRKICPGDVIIGFASSGLHSNGYSLVRRVLGEEISVYGDELLRPTRIYVSFILELVNRFDVKGIAHITGGGLVENIPRIIPEGRRAIIKKGTWRPHPIFHLIQEKGKIEDNEMYRTFNMGIGMVAVVGNEDTEGCMELARSSGESPYLIGKIVEGERGVEITE